MTTTSEAVEQPLQKAKEDLQVLVAVMMNDCGDGDDDVLVTLITNCSLFEINCKREHTPLFKGIKL